jgi:hypothetical protein
MRKHFLHLKTIIADLTRGLKNERDTLFTEYPFVFVCLQTS